MPRWTWYLWTVHQKVFKNNISVCVVLMTQILAPVCFIVKIHVMILPLKKNMFFLRRNFRCDCGNSKFRDFKCQLITVSQLLLSFLNESVSPNLDCWSYSTSSCIHRPKMRKTLETSTITTSMAATAHVTDRIQTQTIRYSSYFISCNSWSFGWNPVFMFASSVAIQNTLLST